jgi:hypothetical protein
MNNETIGMTAEYLLCNYMEIPCDISLSRINIDNEPLKYLIKEFPLNISQNYTHVGSENKSLDFLLDNNKTLSVKTTKSKIKKLCPQNIGQISSMKKFNEKFKTDFKIEFNNIIFKKYILDNIKSFIISYFENLFCCDYIFYIDLFDNKTHLFEKQKIIDIDPSLITFTQNEITWNESCTVKYQNISIGEFQIHKNITCFKFRFIFNGLKTILV